LWLYAKKSSIQLWLRHRHWQLHPFSDKILEDIRSIQFSEAGVHRLGEKAATAALLEYTDFDWQPLPGESHGLAEFYFLRGAEFCLDDGGAEEGDEESGEAGFVLGIPEGVGGAGVSFAEAIGGGGIGYRDSSPDIGEAGELIEWIAEESETRWGVVTERRIRTDEVHVMRVAEAFAEFLDLVIDVEVGGLDEDKVRFHAISRC